MHTQHLLAGRRMAPWGLSLLLLGLLLGCGFAQALSGSGNTSNTKVITSTDGLTQVTVPDNWQDNLDLNDIATLQAGNARQELYLIVISENKSDFVDMDLEQYSEQTIGNILDSLQSSEVSEPETMTINGHQALQKEIRGVIDNLRVIYLHTSIESAENYHQVLVWTLQSQSEKGLPVLRDVVQSFTEVAAAEE